MYLVQIFTRKNKKLFVSVYLPNDTGDIQDIYKYVEDVEYDKKKTTRKKWQLTPSLVVGAVNTSS